MTQRAVVVFVGRELVDGPPWWSFILKPGFLHCFVLIESRGWVKVELRYGSVRITQLGEFDDIVGNYESQGATVVDTVVTEQSANLPMIIRSCVGLIKVMAGIRSFSFTPWQLYKHLTGAPHGRRCKND